MNILIKSTFFLHLPFMFSFFACSQTDRQHTHNEDTNSAGTHEPDSVITYSTTGSIERLDESLDRWISPDAKIEELAEGFKWSEGPVWVAEQQMLLFSDIPPNKVFKWTEKGGLSLYLEPSGYTGQEERGGEVGANGLLLDDQNRLVLCQHGDRRMARMNAPLNDPKPDFITLADKHEGKRLNSPNDAVYHSGGDLYFTDPPYGLEKNINDPAKEIPFQGVYRLDKQGNLHLLTKELSRPNGIAFSPDEQTLYVTNSDGKNPVVMAYPVQQDGNIGTGRVFFDASELAKTNRGMPDGLKVNKQGIVFTTGPGGVLVIDQDGRHLGTIRTGQPTSNCTFNEEENMLYMTANNYLMRVALK